MRDNRGKYIISNGKLQHAQDLKRLYEQSGSQIYEVIRIIGGIPLFFEDHMQRLRRSLERTGPDKSVNLEDVRKSIYRLTSSNGVSNCNVKILVSPCKKLSGILLYIVQSHYPEPEDYRKGVPAAVMKWERSQPALKVYDAHYREAVRREAKRLGVHEVLLVNRSGMITEGSRSNVFIIDSEVVRTAPAGLVLDGITRKHVILACKKCGIEVREECFSVQSAKRAQSLFLSGTSIDVLPVSRLEEKLYNPAEDRVLRRIGAVFSDMVSQYLKEHHTILESR